MAARNFTFIRNLDGSNNPPAQTLVPVAASQTLVPGDAVSLSSGQAVKASTTFGDCEGIVEQVATTLAANTLILISVTKKSQLWAAVATGDATSHILTANTFDLNSSQQVNVSDTSGGSIQIFQLFGSTTAVLIQFTVNDLG